MKRLKTNNLKGVIFFLLIAALNYRCTPKKGLNKIIIGIWQIDSIESYKQGIKQIDKPSKNYYWTFNEYNDLVFFDKDSIIQIHYFKIKDSLISCYNSKKDTSDWAMQFQIIKVENDKMVLQSIYDDNSATKFFIAKTKIANIEDIIKRKTSGVIKDSTRTK